MVIRILSRNQPDTYVQGACLLSDLPVYGWYGCSLPGMCFQPNRIGLIANTIINQSITQSTNQLIINQSTNQSTNQSSINEFSQPTELPLFLHTKKTPQREHGTSETMKFIVAGFQRLCDCRSGASFRRFLLTFFVLLILRCFCALFFFFLMVGLRCCFLRRLSCRHEGTPSFSWTTTLR